MAIYEGAARVEPKVTISGLAFISHKDSSYGLALRRKLPVPGLSAINALHIRENGSASAMIPCGLWAGKPGFNIPTGVYLGQKGVEAKFIPLPRGLLRRISAGLHPTVRFFL